MRKKKFDHCKFNEKKKKEKVVKASRKLQVQRDEDHRTKKKRDEVSS